MAMSGAERSRLYRRRNPERVRYSKAKHRYGVDREEWKILEAVKHCEICGYRPGRGQRRLGVDHDHKTGKVRGVLCHRCNTALGLMNDDRDRLLLAVRYMERKGDAATH